MGGGLMQLVAYGAQDVFLTGKPEISFFKVVYRRHTNFAIEAIEQTINGTIKPGNRLTSTVSRNGDLISNMYLEVDLGDVNSIDTKKFYNSLGHTLIEYVELEIGGQRIDKQYGEWMEILSELTLPEEKRQGFKEMIGRRDAYMANGSKLESNKLFIPLQFFFCRNPGLALPLIALQYHEVKINLKLRDVGDFSSFTNNNELTNFDVKLYVDYVYLDTTERRRFAQMQHEYLIEQLQHTGPADPSDTTQRLNFNHPVKELVWVFRKSGAEPMNFSWNGGGNYVSYGNVDGIGAENFPGYSAIDPTLSSYSSDWFSTMKLQLNGHDRFSERDVRYFRLVQPYQHHSRVPSKHVYVYSFSLNPEAHQPSGTCNFSRLDNVSMKFNHGGNSVTGNDELLVYAVNYNVLRIMSGMGGLAYSN